MIDLIAALFEEWLDHIGHRLAVWQVHLVQRNDAWSIRKRNRTLIRGVVAKLGFNNVEVFNRVAIGF